MEIRSSLIRLDQAAGYALESSGAGFGSCWTGYELLPGLLLLNFLHPQNKGNISCWIPALPCPPPTLVLHPVLTLLAWDKMRLSVCWKSFEKPCSNIFSSARLRGTSPCIPGDFSTEAMPRMSLKDSKMLFLSEPSQVFSYPRGGYREPVEGARRCFRLPPPHLQSL